MKITAIGIDIAKDHLDIHARPTGEMWRVVHSPEQFPALLARLKELAPERIVLEATGGLEVLLATQLAAAALPVVVINPRQARDFAKATGQLAKTDQVDARVLAHFGEALQPPVRPLPDEQTRALEALLTRRRQLVDMMVAEKNRYAALARQPALQKNVVNTSPGSNSTSLIWMMNSKNSSNKVRSFVGMTDCYKACPALAT